MKQLKIVGINFNNYNEVNLLIIKNNNKNIKKKKTQKVITMEGNLLIVS